MYMFAYKSHLFSHLLMKVTAILKGTLDKQGKKTVYIRVNDANERTFKATKIKVQKKDWIEERGLVKSSHPDSMNYNTIIRKLIHETEATYVRTEYRPEKKSNLDFFDYCDRLMPSWEAQRSPDTIKSYLRDMAKLRRFRSSFRLSDVDEEFLNDYRDSLEAEKLDQNTVWSYFKFLRMVIRKACRSSILDKNPFDKFDQPQYRDSLRTFLTEKELALVDQFALDPASSTELKFSANWFLFGCYTGLRYGDKHRFDKLKHMVSGRLVMETKKTGEVISLPILPKHDELLRRVEYRALWISNQRYNTNLKSIMRKCGIDKVVSAHISRHTFATLCASKKISLEVTAKMLGHRRTSVTAIYYKIMDARVDDELMKLV
jgi:integrase/recombinase XerD